MSSETERITNQVMNRPPWANLEERIHKACFEDAESRQLNADDLRTTRRGPSAPPEAVLDLPQ